MKRSPPYKAALVGLGRIASLLEDDTRREKPATHAGALAANGGFEISGGCDTDEERRLAFRERWKVDALFDDPETMLRNVRPDLLVIATWPESHAELVELAVEQGIPLVVCEKPLTEDAPSSRRIVGLCERSRGAGTPGTTLMVNHERRYARDYCRVERLIREEVYGRLLSIFGKIYMGRTRTPAEVLFWDGTHMLDILRYLTGREIDRIQAWGQADEPGSFLMSTFFLGQAPVVLEVGTARDHLVFELDLSFEKGRVRIGNGLYEEHASGESPFYDKMRSLLPVAVDPAELNPSGYFSGMVSDAWHVLHQPGRQPLSRGVDGLRAIEGIEGILKAARKKKTPRP